MRSRRSTVEFMGMRVSYPQYVRLRAIQVKYLHQFLTQKANLTNKFQIKKTERSGKNGPDNTPHGQSLQPAGACSKSTLVRYEKKPYYFV